MFFLTLCYLFFLVGVKTELGIFSQRHGHLRVSGQTVTIPVKHFLCLFTNCWQEDQVQCSHLTGRQPHSGIKKRLDFKTLTLKIVIRYQRLNGFENESNANPKWDCTIITIKLVWN